MSENAEPPAPPPSLARIFRIWLLIGLQSFGGGVATLTLIRQTAVTREKWIDNEQFITFWALCQITPGINLLAFAILIGRRTNGFAGALVALAGLLLPSAFLTIAMTAAYHAVQGSPITQRAIGGLIPASIGLGFVTAYGMGRPLLKSGISKGWGMGFVSILLILASGAVMISKAAPPVIAVLAGAGAVLAIANLIYDKRAGAKA